MEKQTFNLIGWTENLLIPDGYIGIMFNVRDITFKIVKKTGEFLKLEVTEWKEKTKCLGKPDYEHVPDGFYNNWLEKGTITGGRPDIERLMQSLSVATTENDISYKEPETVAMQNLADNISSLSSSLSFIETAIETRFPKLEEKQEEF
jgi:hypothetical protein